MKHDNINSAAALLGEGLLDAGRLRPFFNQKGEPCYVANDGLVYRANGALLRYDEWKEIDTAVIQVATDRLVGIAHLISGGLTHNLGSIGVTISQWDRESDMTEANVSMSGVTAGEEDTPAYDQDSVPVPVVHKDFRLNIRRLEASRRMGESLDTTGGRIAARKVSEASEDMLFDGKGITVGSDTIYGYTNFPGRSTVDMGTVWTSVTDNQDIIDDVLEMVQSARDNNYRGPFTLYVPSAYWGKLQEEFKANYPKTVRQRILEIDGVNRIEVADRLTGDNVVLVQLTSDVVDLAIAQDVTTVNWSENGGMTERFKVMAVWVPRLKRDYNGVTGIVHLRPA